MKPENRRIEYKEKSSMTLRTTTKLVIDSAIILLINIALYFLLNSWEWYILDPEVFLKISVLYLLICFLTLLTGRIYSFRNREKKSIFIFVLGTMILKTVVSIGLIVILFALGELTQNGEIFPVLSIYLIYTYLIIRILKFIDK